MNKVGWHRHRRWGKCPDAGQCALPTSVRPPVVWWWPIPLWRATVQWAFEPRNWIWLGLCLRWVCGSSFSLHRKVWSRRNWRGRCPPWRCVRPRTSSCQSVAGQRWCRPSGTTVLCIQIIKKNKFKLNFHFCGKRQLPGVLSHKIVETASHYFRLGSSVPLLAMAARMAHRNRLVVHKVIITVQWDRRFHERPNIKQTNCLFTSQKQICKVNGKLT